MASERQQTAELQARLNSSTHEKLAAAGERQKLELEVQRLGELLKWHQEKLSSTKEALMSSQSPVANTTHLENRPSPVEGSRDESSAQVTGSHVR